MSPNDNHAGKAALSLEHINDMMGHVPRDSELLVGADDPELGPYTKTITVLKSDVEATCGPRWRRLYRKITGYEIDAMMGEIEDYAETWRCNN